MNIIIELHNTYLECHEIKVNMVIKSRRLRERKTLETPRKTVSSLSYINCLVNFFFPR